MGMIANLRVVFYLPHCRLPPNQQYQAVKCQNPAGNQQAGHRTGSGGIAGAVCIGKTPQTAGGTGRGAGAVWGGGGEEVWLVADGLFDCG